MSRKENFNIEMYEVKSMTINDLSMVGSDQWHDKAPRFYRCVTLKAASTHSHKLILKEANLYWSLAIVKMLGYW